MAHQIIPNNGRDIIVSMHYDPTGLEFVVMFDNIPLGWAIDAGALQASEDAAPGASAAPVPIIIGTLPPKAAVDTSPVLSPQWGTYVGGYISIPDVVSLRPAEFFEWLRSNNGATRQIQSQLKHPDLVNAFAQWSH